MHWVVLSGIRTDARPFLVEVVAKRTNPPLYADAPLQARRELRRTRCVLPDPRAESDSARGFFIFEVFTKTDKKLKLRNELGVEN